MKTIYIANPVIYQQIPAGMRVSAESVFMIPISSMPMETLPEKFISGIRQKTGVKVFNYISRGKDRSINLYEGILLQPFNMAPLHNAYSIFPEIILPNRAYGSRSRNKRVARRMINRGCKLYAMPVDKNFFFPDAKEETIDLLVKAITCAAAGDFSHLLEVK